MKVFKAFEFIKELVGQDEKIHVVLRKNLSNLPIEEQEGDEVLEKIKSKNITGYEIKDFNDFLDIFNYSKIEVLRKFGMYDIRLDDGSCIILLPFYILNLIPDGTEVNYLGGNRDIDILNKKTLLDKMEELNMEFDVYPIGFIKEVCNE